MAYVVKVGTVKHDDKTFNKGDTVEGLSKEQTEALVSAGVLEQQKADQKKGS